MKIVTLNTPSTVYCHWTESDDRRRHDLSLFVDGWEVAPCYTIVWLEGESIEEAIEMAQLVPGEGPGWYVVDACGDVCPDLEPFDVGGGPLDRFAWQEIKAKLQALNEVGDPPANPLQEFYLEGKRYQGKHRFRAEDCRDGVLINPELPAAFDDTPNDVRLLSDIEDWWDRPFILTRRLDQQLEDYSSYEVRCRCEGWEPSMTAEEWEARQEDIRQQWKQRYPRGTSYDVRCLDGGAWDRSTWWGDADTLEAALAIASNGPRWRQQGGALS